MKLLFSRKHKEDVLDFRILTIFSSIKTTSDSTCINIYYNTLYKITELLRAFSLVDSCDVLDSRVLLRIIL